MLIKHVVRFGTQVENLQKPAVICSEIKCKTNICCGLFRVVFSPNERDRFGLTITDLKCWSLSKWTMALSPAEWSFEAGIQFKDRLKLAEIITQFASNKCDRNRCCIGKDNLKTWKPEQAHRKIPSIIWAFAQRQIECFPFIDARERSRNEMALLIRFVVAFKC